MSEHLGTPHERYAMKVGLYFDLRNPPGWPRDSAKLYGFTLEMCEEVERLGGDSVWVTEHHLFEDGYLPQPLTFLAAVAARTRRVRLGTAVMLAPLRSAVQIAEEAAIVDIFSNGRLDLGLGAGYRKPEFDLYGADIKNRYNTLDQRVGELRALWTQGKVTPHPVQSRIPIWMGYQGPKGAHRAGLLGERLLCADAAMFDPYRAGLIAGGYDPRIGSMAGTFESWISEDPESDWPIVSAHLRYQLDSYRRHMVEGTDQPIPRPVDVDKIRQRPFGTGGLLGSFLHATPEDAAAQIKRYTAGAPVDTVFFWASIGGMPDEMVARQIQLICTRLRPLLA
jgi:alkanesulfonate monooxygenase SsuD/methylene tetrahydromethanopterin reductase-like flavin-dependent oxidoreductase (luciferase family)